MPSDRFSLLRSGFDLLQQSHLRVLLRSKSPRGAAERYHDRAHSRFAPPAASPGQFLTEEVRSRPEVREAVIEARRAERREDLLDAAIRAIRRDGPGVSMGQMAAEAGVTKPILYRHFGAKGGLYHAIAERYATELLSRIRSALAQDLPSRELLVATLDAYVAFLERETQVHRFLVERALHERPETGQVFLSGFREQVAAELANVLRQRLVPALGAVAPEPWAHALVGMAEFAGEWWLRQDGMSRSELVEDLATLLWTGFSSVAPDARPVPSQVPESVEALTGASGKEQP